MRNRIFEIPLTTMLTMLGIGLTLILLAFVIVGLFGGAMKEIFYHISSAQGFSTKANSCTTEPVSILIAQE